MAASYPGALKSYTVKTNKVDLVDAAHMNSVQEEIVAAQTELGTDVAGSCTDLKTRLYVCIGNDGAVRQGTTLPADPIQGQLFWKSDESTMYVRASAAWQALGGNLSNVIFNWYGVDIGAANSFGLYQGTSLVPNMGAYTPNYSFLGVVDNTLRTVLRGRFVKIAGISTITIHARLWATDTEPSAEAILKVDIGGQNNTVKSVTSATPTWVTTSTIDVSGLTNGTTYDITMELYNENGTSDYNAYCSAVVLTAS